VACDLVTDVGHAFAAYGFLLSCVEITVSFSQKEDPNFRWVYASVYLTALVSQRLKSLVAMVARVKGGIDSSFPHFVNRFVAAVSLGFKETSHSGRQ